MKILVSPHNDDESLFAAFTLLREKPLVVIVYDGFVQQARGADITAKQRRTESLAACGELECEVKFLGFRDDSVTSVEQISAALQALEPIAVWAPAYEGQGHHQHNLVAAACNGLPVVDRYLTYTPSGKSEWGREVPIERGEWIAAKLRALACYESQHRIDPRLGCWPHFTRGLTEYYL